MEADEIGDLDGDGFIYDVIVNGSDHAYN